MEIVGDITALASPCSQSSQTSSIGVVWGRYAAQCWLVLSSDALPMRSFVYVNAPADSALQRITELARVAGALAFTSQLAAR